tara:strand:- start:559 stop:1017 length:459 start_codon:yes stop_codon:yes gene_type:complete
MNKIKEDKNNAKSIKSENHTTESKKETEKKDVNAKKTTKSNLKTQKNKPTEKFAVIESGGKQYKVNEGLYIDIEHIKSKVNDKIEFNNVLLIHSPTSTKIGTPYLKNTTVTGSIISQTKSPKTLVFKFKRKTGYKKTQGHRQLMTTVKIEKI